MIRLCSLGTRSPGLAARPLVSSVLQSGRGMAADAGPTTATPPPDAARGATADLCDVFIKDPVDTVRQHPVSIVEPIFRCSIQADLTTLTAMMRSPSSRAAEPQWWAWAAGARLRVWEAQAPLVGLTSAWRLRDPIIYKRIIQLGVCA